MTSWTVLRGALLLAAMFHASSSWDSSNIWFPDTNNPVFYNMTFYQQAAQTAVDDTADNLIPATDEPPRFQNRPRPPVFNRLPEALPVRPTEAPPPKVVQRFKKPVRNRQPSPPTTSNGRFQFQDSASQSSDMSRLIAEQQLFIRNEQNPFGNPVRDANPAPRPQSAMDRLAAEQQAFIRNEQNGFRNPATRRHSGGQHDVFVRNEQRPEFYPDVAVGYKTVPLEETTSAAQTYYNHHAGNRLRRTKNEGIADGDGGRFTEQQRRWNGHRDVFSPVQRAVDPAEDRRRWYKSGPTTGVATSNYPRVEDNVIAGRETSPSKPPSGPSKCVWAIISCCKPSSPQIRYTCFETLGCHGAFWDTNPCSKEMTMAAVQATANFYNVPRPTEDY